MKLKKFMFVLLFAMIFSTIGIALSNPEPAAATGGVFAVFQNTYPDSDTTNADCQVCHMNPGGGEPWNAYGWSIREGVYNDGLSYADAIAAVALLDADMNGISNVEEINASAAPGWTEGDVHTIYFKDGSTIVDQPPPDLSIELDASMTVTEPMTGTTPLPKPPISSTVPYDEATDGDLSGDPYEPNIFSLGAGSNVITATSVQGDREYFSIIVPEGYELDAIVLESYESESEKSFIGIQAGTYFTEPYTNAVASNLLGYVLPGAEPAEAGTDILGDMGQGEGAQGFSGPLPAGTYAFWSQETSPNAATYRLNFVVKSKDRIYLPILYIQ